MKLWLVTFGLVLLIALAAYTASDEVDEAQLELELYCELVKIRKTTQDPLLGWPDYKQIYDKQCVISEPPRRL
jgi:hypothetical protein